MVFIADGVMRLVKATCMMLFPMLVLMCAPGQIAAQQRTEIAATARCAGLHAGIRAVLQRREMPYSHPPFIDLSFVLLNDSQRVIDSSPGSWKIVINGKELADSGWIFGNGLSPSGGYGKLNPGDSYEFGKGLDISKYFPRDGEYRVSWRGQGFQSSTIDVILTADQR